MLKILDLHKSFKRKEILKGISINLDTGIYGLLGKNGAGKTTLMRCIVNLYNTTKGNIKFQEKDIANNTSFSKSIGYLPQKFGLFKELTVYEMMEYFAVLKKLPKESMDMYIKSSLEIVNLEDKLKDKISTLSGGMIRRLGIAQAILGSPKIIIFDEPTAGLDPEERLRFKNLLSHIKKDKIIIISTHIVEDVEACCDKIIIMDNGKILKEGTSDSIKSVAKGKVFEIPEEAKINFNHFVEKTFEKDGKRFLRILSNENQEYTGLEPTIEDGYMCLLKGI
ncbi:ATP-binding cassette domain-containing protein [Clostridium sp. K25]|uniref:ATP-binding cassette domain-containing protein n=1 Tax=Clostridium sp. K25 TaxID=1443109 RepID=UPI0004D4BE73|nr:ATP-binding cassette domain-containing protein [Clostridium sp. K25]KEI06296.1 ABC transporter ATP-binding protein [Clostridium sp. K25]